MTNKTLVRLDWPPFHPRRGLNTGFSQTVAAAFWPRVQDRLAQIFHTVTLDDGDQLSLVVNRPAGWQQGQRAILMVHGLTGSHESVYMIRIAERLFRQGHLIVRVNLRGCGSGAGLARLPYHSGRSEDIRAVLHWMKQNYSGSPVTLIGFSLGANITMKLVGEDADNISGNMDSFVAVSPPASLEKTAIHLTRPRNLVFDQFFVWRLKRDIAELHSAFPDLPPIRFPHKMRLTDFDDLYTAPRSGFTSAADYYSKSSAARLAHCIQVPGLVLCAHDDPIVDATGVANLPLNQNVELVMTEKGGHVGFLSRTTPNGDALWMDGLIERWVGDR